MLFHLQINSHTKPRGYLTQLRGEKRILLKNPLLYRFYKAFYIIFSVNSQLKFADEAVMKL